jgi:hypothetical protein
MTVCGGFIFERDEVGDSVFVGLKVQSCVSNSQVRLCYFYAYFMESVVNTAVEMLSSTKLISITFNVKIHKLDLLVII